MSEIRDALRGCSIVDIYLHPDNDRIAIVVGGTNYMVSVIYLETEGDCCSQSWIEHIGNPEASHMARFEDWCEVNIDPSPDNLTEEQRSAYDCGELKLYFFRLSTSKGETLIEMRNSSNGYYGGMLNYRGTYPFLDRDLEAEGFKLAREK